MATDLVAYAIYPDRDRFEAALEALRAAGFRNSDISAILPERIARQETSRTKSTPRLQRVRRPAPAPGRPLAAYLGGSWVSGRSPFLESGLSWRQGRSSRRWPAPAPGAQLAASSVV